MLSKLQERLLIPLLISFLLSHTEKAFSVNSSQKQQVRQESVIKSLFSLLAISYRKMLLYLFRTQHIN